MLFKEDYINTIFENLPEYTTQELAEISGLFNNSLFKRVINDLLKVKADFIADEIEEQEDLDKIRYTRMGNKEILQMSELFDTYYKDRLEQIKEEKESDV
jgi:hypothetical protein